MEPTQCVPDTDNFYLPTQTCTPIETLKSQACQTPWPRHLLTLAEATQMQEVRHQFGHYVNNAVSATCPHAQPPDQSAK